jgi:hypothetical protein
MPDFQPRSNDPIRSNPPIATEKLQFEAKQFFIDLKENQRGRFFTITEDVRGRRNRIMLPLEAAKDFIEALTRIADFESKLDAQ